MIKLGDEVVDTVSGFKGIAISNTKYLHGCNRISVQPKVQKDSSLPELQVFDETRLKTVKKASEVKLGFRT